ncbi:MAG: glucosamine-6-phosphate deaminase [Candidatus Aenigmarchaeota archaeon]|nr:glucosamine-6-phosphate deaminase [Candidatus Aenigmarchaeota archaeon]
MPKVEVVKDYKELSEHVAYLIKTQLDRKHDATFLLPTGGTFLGAYDIISHARPGTYDFSEATIFNLDERLGTPPTDPHSFQRYMRKNLIDQINVKPENVHLMDGSVMSPERNDAYCKAFDRMLGERGVDYCWLGIGGEGHIGYNEAGSPFGSTTRVVDFSPRTIEDMLAEYDNDASRIPTKGRTVGIRNILASREPTLAASKGKASAVYMALKCKPDRSCPASALQTHENALFIIDEAAASELLVSAAPS